MVGEFASHGREAAPSTKTPMPSEDLGGGGGMRPSARWGAVIKAPQTTQQGIWPLPCGRQEVSEAF